MERIVLAVVNGKEITNLDVEDVLKTLDPYQGMQFNSEDGKKRLLEDLIHQELFFADAKEQNLHNEEKFRAEMNRIEENMLKQYAINGVISTATLTDEEVQAFYDANQEKFVKPEQATAKHILVDTEEKANELLTKINAGEVTFEDAAAEHSSCPSKEAGGSLGTFGKGQMVPEFEEAVFSMKNGDVSAPVQTQFGYHIIKLEERNAGGVAAFDEVKEEVSKSLLYQKQNEVYTAKVLDLKSKYDIQINE